MATIATELKPCANCGVEMVMRPRDIRRGKKYCSRECYKSAAWDGAWLPARTCKTCGEQYSVRKSEERKNQEYCSVECRIKARPKLTCEYCNKTFRVYPSYAKSHVRRYCSIECRDMDRVAEVVEKECETCGSAFKVARTQIDFQKRHGLRESSYCSRKCMGVGMRDITVPTRYRGGYRDDLGHMVRSSWEANFARFLNYMGHKYGYEVRSFDLGDTSYRPDFLVDGYWVEVKGWMRPDAAKKIAKFREIYPDETLVVVDTGVYHAIEKEFSSRIPEWEFKSSRRVSP